MKTGKTLALALAAAALLGGAALAQQRTPRTGEAGDTIVGVSNNDPEMDAAIRRSRAGLPAFYRRLADPVVGDSEFMVKFDIVPGPRAEFVWATDLNRSRVPMTGRLLNQPEQAPVQVGDRVSIPEEAIIDWSYTRDNVMQGAYTQRLIVDRMPPELRARYRAQFGW